MKNLLVLALRGGEFTAPMHSATISGDGRWIRVRSADLTPLEGASAPEEPTVAVSAGAYGRTWAVVVDGAIAATAEQAVAAIRNAAPAMELAQRLLAGLVEPARAPAAPAAADDLDDD